MNVQKLIGELYDERRWLEAMINALEIAGRYPAPHLAVALAQSLGQARSPRSALELSASEKAKLLRLARQVHPKGPQAATHHSAHLKVVPIRRTAAA